MSTDLMGKRLQLLKETLPHLSRLAVIGGPIGTALLVQETEGAARALGVTLQILQVGNPDDIPPTFAAMTRGRAEALYVTETLFVGLPQVIDLAAQSRLPTFCALRACVDLGGLMSYGPNIPELSRGTARYVDRILKGAKPADLPVEQPLTFELVINLKTAKALGLTIPPTLLFQADEVIQ
jgi:putative ABC transport system substrate-binding protein